jgi:hypothetical protein
MTSSALAGDIQQMIEGTVYKDQYGEFCTSLQAAKELFSLPDMAPLPKGCFTAEIEYEASYKIAGLSKEMETIVLDPQGPDLCTFKEEKKFNCRKTRQKNGIVAARMNYRGTVIRIFVLVDDRVGVLPKDTAR